MSTVIGRPVVLPSQKVLEARQAGIAIWRLAPNLTDELRGSLARDLLIRLEAEKKAREAHNLNHWAAHARARIYAIAEQLLTERAARVAAYLKANGQRLETLAFRVTRDRALADEIVIQTFWEFWTGRTFEEVLDRALVMNARNKLEGRAARSRRFDSVERIVGAAEAHGDSDLPSHRLEDQDPLEILLAREDQKETNDELTYALQNVRRSENWWILQTNWWQASGLAELERSLRTSEKGGSPE